MEVTEVSIIDYETAYVRALIDDFVLTHSQTLYDPPEYGPALCYCYVNISDAIEYTTEVPINTKVKSLKESITEYVEFNDMDWKVCDDY